MIMQEQGNNTFTKEHTDIEKYLLRIIQRYFEIENNYSKATIESIIVESLTRFKRLCKSEGKGYLFSFNQQAGHINIDINYFGGELAFKKNTAFNKDFGTKRNTICTGDDPRLTNERVPLPHTHDYTEINELNDALKQFNIPSYMHSHMNSNIINMLTYTGNASAIDMAIIEQVRKQLPIYQANAAKISAEMTTSQNVQMDRLNSSIYALNSYVENIALNLIFGYQWVQDVKKDFNSRIKAMQDYANKEFSGLVSVEDYQNLTEEISTIYRVTDTGDFDIHLTVDGIKNITHNGQSYAVYNTVNDTASLPVVEPDSLVNLYFQYQDDNNNTIQSPLPFVFQDEMGNSIVIDCGIKDNTAIYRTLMLAKFSGQAAYDESYNNGNSFILRTNNKLNFYDATVNAENNKYAFIEYDPKNAKQNTLIESIAGGDSFYIGSFYDVDLEKYINVNDSPCKFTETETNTDGIVYYKDGKLYDAMNVDMHEQLFEIPIPSLSDFYKNPQIHYEVLKKGV